MAKNKVANEHYVPQAYLKSFSNSNEQCYVYDKINNKHFRSHISNILAERYLYDFPEELLKDISGLDTQSVEKILGNTVDVFWKNIAENIEQNFGWFSTRYSYHFLDTYRCATIQLLRTPKGKKMLLNIYQEAYKRKIDENSENAIFAHELLKIFDDNMQSVFWEFILNEYSHISVGLNETDIPIISSDNPIVVLPSIWNKGETMIYYPITPKRCILFMKRKYVECQLNTVMKDVLEMRVIVSDLSDITQEAYNREKAMLKILNPETIDLKQEDIIVLNTYIAKSSERFIISNQNMKIKTPWIDL